MTEAKECFALLGGTIIDGRGGVPIESGLILTEGDRIRFVGPGTGELPPSAQVIDVSGKFVLPGLMDANVHLMAALRMEDLIRHETQYEALIVEAAQVALKCGVTTVFDTWGPLPALLAVRDAIRDGREVGSRIFCAGNIVGLDGPFSEDFFPKTLEVASVELVNRINAIWTQGVGPELTWMTPNQVRNHLSNYIDKGVDFIKYASSEHRTIAGPTAYLAFSPDVQRVINEIAHERGITSQAHTMSVESLRVSINAGVDILQHANITGPTPIPDDTIALLRDSGAFATVFPITDRRLRWMRETKNPSSGFFSDVSVDTNVRKLISSGFPLLLATDAGVMAPKRDTDPDWVIAAAGADNLFELGEGHINWMKAMEEKGFSPMSALLAATSNVANAYGVQRDLGTLEKGKIADVLVLDKDPLQRPESYRAVNLVMKSGKIVDREALPLKPVLSGTHLEEAPKAIGSYGLPSCCRH